MFYGKVRQNFRELSTCAIFACYAHIYTLSNKSAKYFFGPYDKYIYVARICIHFKLNQHIRNGLSLAKRGKNSESLVSNNQPRKTNPKKKVDIENEIDNNKRDKKKISSSLYLGSLAKKTCCKNGFFIFFFFYEEHHPPFSSIKLTTKVKYATFLYFSPVFISFCFLVTLLQRELHRYYAVVVFFFF